MGLRSLALGITLLVILLGETGLTAGHPAADPASRWVRTFTKGCPAMAAMPCRGGVAKWGRLWTGWAAVCRGKNWRPSF